MQKKCSIVTLIISVVAAMLITFEVAYLLLNWRNKLDYRDLTAEYNSSLNELVSEIEDLTAQNEKLQNTYSSNEVLNKLALIDYIYQNKYVNGEEAATSDELQEILAYAYIYAMGDKYATYYNKEEYADRVSQLKGNLVGIGIMACYNSEYDAIEILLVMDDSPALESGLKKGDLIVSVDSKTITEAGYSTSLSNVKGESGTDVTLTVLRDGEELQFTITRRETESQSVIYHKFDLDETIGVIKITDFNSATPKQFKAAVEALLNDGATSLVFDMRNNTGGTLSSVVSMLDYLLPEGDIVYITDADGQTLETYTSDASCIDVPMVVLVNGKTASAAELFTAALKDYEKATVVGTQTYGKGTVQTVQSLGDGTALSYSAYMYNPPKSENFEGVGITPDIVVEENEIIQNNNLFKVEDKDDNQLIEACKTLGYENND